MFAHIEVSVSGPKKIKAEACEEIKDGTNKANIPAKTRSFECLTMTEF
jgi:hypothetical protein